MLLEWNLSQYFCLQVSLEDFRKWKKAGSFPSGSNLLQPVVPHELTWVDLALYIQKNFAKV